MAKKAKKPKKEEPRITGRPRPEVKEFKAKIVAILPQINRKAKGRVRGQEKWGFMLEKESGQQTALWGHWMRPFSEAGISKLKVGDTLLITYRNSHDWSWEPVKAKKQAKAKRKT